MSDTPPLPSPFPVPPGLAFGQVLDRIFKLFRSHLGLIMRLGIVPAGALLLIYALSFGALFQAGFFTGPGKPPDARALWVIFLVAGVACVAFMYVYALYEAAACHAALQAHDGFPITARDAFRAATAKVGRLVWLMILRTLVVVAPGMAGAALIAGPYLLMSHAARNSASVLILIPVLMTVLYLGWLVFMVFAMLRLALAVPACVAEDLTATDALKRSLQLTKNSKGRVFLVLLVVYAATYVAIFVMEILVSVVAMVVMLLAIALHIQLSPPWSYVGIGFAAVCGGAVFLMFMMATWALYAISFVVLYRDQRLRLEGSLFASPAGGPK